MFVARLILFAIFCIGIPYIIGMAFHEEEDDDEQASSKTRIPSTINFLFFARRKDLQRDVRGIGFQCGSLINSLVLASILSQDPTIIPLPVIGFVVILPFFLAIVFWGFVSFRAK